jgi:flavin-dependent dehydrogenase
VDVCDVGAGPAGAVAAKRLAESGFGVVVLEQGDWPDYSRARAAELDFEIDSGPEWEWNPNVRRLQEDYPVDTSDSDIDVLT